MKLTKKKNVSRKKLVAQKKSSFLLKILIIIVVLLGIYALRFSPQLFQQKLKSNVKISKNIHVSVTPAEAPPAEKNTPTPIPKPTIPPGYCLSVPVIFYHHIEPISEATTAGHAQLTVDSAKFETHMQYLNDRGYVSITAEELVAAVTNHTPLPGKPIVVSIDDGYSDIYNYAFPIIKKYNIKTSLFISTGLLGNTGYMNWENLREMMGSGLVSVYNHTWSHYSLGRGDSSKIAHEIDTAQKQLEEYLGIKPTIFAYPYGITSQAAIDVLKQSGFKGAFTTVNSWYQCDSRLYSLPRIRIGNAPLSYFGL
jgi:peptidoglycan/xylan/chitin deacetylase (PgdA/CDA1 family)